MNGQTERTEDASEEVTEAAETAAEQAAEAAETVTEEATGGDAAIEELQAKADENWDRYLRAAAELENVRKRAARDADNARKFALERFGGDLLEVLDSLEMGLQASEAADAEQLRAGAEATLKLLGSTLKRNGIEEVDPLGEPFNPEFHEAMTMQPSADVEPGSVLTVFQKGYSLNGRLLRPALVMVAK